MLRLRIIRLTSHELLFKDFIIISPRKGVLFECNQLKKKHEVKQLLEWFYKGNVCIMTLIRFRGQWQ